MNGPDSKISPYYDTANVDLSVKDGHHREVVGGMWDEIGLLQFNLMKEQGSLRPEHKLLDIGCGSLRGGVHFVHYLETGNYYGIDINQSFMDAGYERELSNTDKDKLPLKNLQCNSDFDFEIFDTKFDMAIALSLFTHLSLNHIRVCLERLAEVMKPGGRFLASFFEFETDTPSWKDCIHQPGGIITHAFSDPYHYRFDDFVDICKVLPWKVHYVGEVKHPRAQRMIMFEREGLSKNDYLPVNQQKRNLSYKEAAQLPPGDDHYRAYVGPPDRFDFMSATQFALLFHLGLRDEHKVLDFGCGSLRLGRLLIPFLVPEGYFGIDPNSWLIEDALDNEIGRGILKIKLPYFNHNSDFNCDVFEKKFDFIMAQSILTHTGADLTNKFFASASKALVKDGIILFSYIKSEENPSELPDNGWHYPGCVDYSDAQLLRLLSVIGLIGKPLPWYHPGAAWFVAGKTNNSLPSDDHLDYLTGTVIRAAQFADSLTAFSKK